MPPLNTPVRPDVLIVSSAFAHRPLWAVILVLGLLISLGALFQRLNGLAFGHQITQRPPA